MFSECSLPENPGGGALDASHHLAVAFVTGLIGRRVRTPSGRREFVLELASRVGALGWVTPTSRGD